MNFTFVNIFYLHNVSIGADNVKSFNDTYSLTIMAEDISNCGQEVLTSVSVSPENTTALDYIFRNYLILTLISFCTSIFLRKESSQFLKIIYLDIFKTPNNSIDFDLKSC